MKIWKNKPGTACLVTVLFVVWKTFHRNLLGVYYISAFLFIVKFTYIYIYIENKVKNYKSNLLRIFIFLYMVSITQLYQLYLLVAEQINFRESSVTIYWNPFLYFCSKNFESLRLTFFISSLGKVLELETI